MPPTSGDPSNRGPGSYTCTAMGSSSDRRRCWPGWRNALSLSLGPYPLQKAIHGGKAKYDRSDAVGKERALTFPASTQGNPNPTFKQSSNFSSNVGERFPST